MREEKRIFKEAAKERLKDSNLLYKNNRVHIAFYLLGYCIECSIKYFIINSLGCNNIEEAEKKVGPFYYHIDKVEKGHPILYRRMRFLKLQIYRINPRISKNRNFDSICNKLCNLIGKFFGTYGWRIQLRYSSDYSLSKNYPQDYNFKYIEDNFQDIFKDVGEIIWKI